MAKRKKCTLENSYTFHHTINNMNSVVQDILNPCIAIKEYGGYKVKVKSVRLQTFAEKGLKCSNCGLRATHFSVDSNGSSPHLNLWGRKPNGSLMLFTHDHTLARSLGGSDHIDNCTTMCSSCNYKKSIGEREILWTQFVGPRQPVKKNKPRPSQLKSKAKVHERLKSDPEYRKIVIAKQRELGRNDYNLAELNISQL